MSEFVMADAKAVLHSWTITRSGQLECEQCGALATVQGGTHYRLYPADPNRDCEIKTAPVARPHIKPERDDGQKTRVTADFGQFSVMFTKECDPSYVAAVIGALQRAS